MPSMEHDGVWAGVTTVPGRSGHDRLAFEGRCVIMPRAIAAGGADLSGEEN